MLVWDIIPDGLSFDVINKTLKKKEISGLLNTCYRQLGLKKTVIFSDHLMYLGYRFATFSGVSIGINDLEIPSVKGEIIERAEAEVKEIEKQFSSGLVTQGERYSKVVDIWSHTNEKVAKAMMEKISTESVVDAGINKVE